MKNGKNGKSKIPTARDVDRYALLDQRIKMYQGQLDELKDKFKSFLQPGEQAVGYAFVVEKSAVPVVKEKMDYRAALVGVVGEEQVLVEEAKLGTYEGTPRLSVKPNPSIQPEAAKITARIAEEIRVSV